MCEVSLRGRQTELKGPRDISLIRGETEAQRRSRQAEQVSEALRQAGHVPPCRPGRHQSHLSAAQQM